MTSASSLRARISAKVGRLNIDVELDTGIDTLVLVGPNGAGKTSLLSLLLGVLPVDKGRIQVGDTVLRDTEVGIDLPVEERRLAYVPQDFALFPHLTVEENVAFAVRSGSGGYSEGGAEAAIVAALRNLNLAELAARSTHSLSGGERQRVALARALSVKPRALLFDEPLAALDLPARREVRAFLARTLTSLALPTIVVTHDPIDARALGKRVLVLESGRITQAGTWDELAQAPASRFVEEFLAAGPQEHVA